VKLKKGEGGSSKFNLSPKRVGAISLVPDFAVVCKGFCEDSQNKAVRTNGEGERGDLGEASRSLLLFTLGGGLGAGGRLNYRGFLLERKKKGLCLLLFGSFNA